MQRSIQWLWGYARLVLLALVAHWVGMLPATPAAVAQSSNVSFVTGSGLLLANTNLWLFCYGDERGQNLLSQRWIATNEFGKPATALPTPCPWLVVLHQKHEQPSNKPGHGPAYWLFEASWQFTSETMLPVAADGEIVVKRPFILFNIVAAIEWETAPSEETITQLYNGLGAAAHNLADLTDGYMGIGPVTIASGGRNWEGADIRVQSANDLRPAAFVGGIVPDAIQYHTGFVEPTFKPAAIFLGRKWNGRDAVSGEWDEEAGWRTLVHEWLHYALFLYDEYQTSSGARAYCTADDLAVRIGDSGAASALAYHYTASELWHPGHTPTPNPLCEGSDQFRVYHKADWLTLEDWYAIQRLAGLSEWAPLAPPDVLPEPKPEDATAWGALADLFGRSPARAGVYIPYVSILGTGTPPPLAAVHTLSVTVAADLALTHSVASQVYLLDSDGGASDPLAVNRILNQGNIRTASAPTVGLLGEIELLGITPGDQARLYVNRYATTAVSSPTPGRFTYQVDEDVPTTAPLDEDLWEASLDFVYTVEVDGTGSGRLTTLEVVLHSSNRLDELDASPPLAMLCVPDGEIGCNGGGWQQIMSNSSLGVYTATFVTSSGSAELPLYGVVRVSAPGAGELVRWYRDLGGVGPGHMFGGAALRDGVMMVDTLEGKAKPGRCNRVLAMPATSYPALAASMPPTTTLVSLPLDIDILLTKGKEPCQSKALEDVEVPDGIGALRLTLFYNEDAITRLDVDETTLHILHFERASGGQGEGLWEFVPLVTNVDGDLNWAATLIEEDGIYALVAEIPGP